MLRAGARDGRGLRCGVFCLATLIAVATVATTASDADARGRRHHARRAVHVERYEPSPASIVIDANSGAVLSSSNPDSPRHPASLTKIMTLYLLFERLENGKIKLTSDLPVSSHAAAQAPSKLGLKPGETLKVETAIRALVTKSANDVAVMVGEAIGGDEPSFAQMMTAKARALGMKSTTYRNASGLPDDAQITTARDQALLGRAIQDRFPIQYRYFATRTFEFRGKSVRNHNHLLGAVEGVDGIKTGYIHDSGFNIVTSARRNGRHVIAVVFGGRTAKARDARVVSLINNNINIAAVKRTTPPIVEGWETVERAKEAIKHPAVASVLPLAAPAAPVAAQAAPPAIAQVATAPAPEVTPVVAAPVAQAAAAHMPEPGSTAPIKPNAVKTVAVHPGATMQTASLSPLPSDNRKLTPGVGAKSVTTVATVKNENVKSDTIGVLSAKVASAAPAATSVYAVASDTAATRPRAGGWMIQVGAFPEEKEAKDRLSTCQSKVKDQLAKAEPFTEKTVKGDKSLYRARFAGLDKDQAEAACKALKHSDIPCMLLKN